MRKKFGGYTINCSKLEIRETMDPNIYEVKISLWGNIEIGIEINRMTWREDWILQAAFKDNYTKYSIIKLEQNDHYKKDPTSGCSVEHNDVYVLVRKER